MDIQPDCFWNTVSVHFIPYAPEYLGTLNKRINRDIAWSETRPFHHQHTCLLLQKASTEHLYTVDRNTYAQFFNTAPHNSPSLSSESLPTYSSHNILCKLADWFPVAHRLAHVFTTDLPHKDHFTTLVGSDSWCI